MTRLAASTAQLVLAAAVCAGGVQDRQQLAAELKEYHALLDAYGKGENRTVDEILAWERDRLSIVIAAARTPVDPVRWDDARVRTAVMLHTDVAMRALDADDPRLSFHLGLASRHLEKAGSDARPFAETWYMTVARVLRDRAWLFVAEGFLDRARQHLPRNAVLLYESGVLQEQIGTFTALVNIIVTEIPVPGRHGGVSRPVEKSVYENRALVDNTRALQRAADWLRDSLQADGSSQLARLHLGRVQGLRGRYDEAAGLLAPLAASDADADTAYLATMFLGAMHQRRGRHAEAEAMYRDAIRRIPAAQSAYVALSETLQKLGRGDESRDVLLALLRTPAVKRTEPWWWYLQEPVGDAVLRLDELRKSVRP